MFSSKKDKAQIKGDFDPACTQEDSSGCEPKAGTVKKVNSRGVWQSRYFYLNNNFLVYKESASAPASKIKGAVDLSLVDNVQSSPDTNEVNIRMAGGENFPLRCDTGDDMWSWVAAVEGRIAWIRGGCTSTGSTGGSIGAVASAVPTASKPAGGKAQLHGGYKSSVYAKDSSACTPMRGNLKKINSSNIWQTRYFYLNNEFLIYKKDSAAGDKDIKGALDVTDMLHARPGASHPTDVEIVLKTGEPFILRCHDDAEVSKWCRALAERIEWKRGQDEALSRLAAEGADGEAALPAELASDLPVCPKISGWLKKKGKHKYSGQQERHCRVEDFLFRYYKTDAPNAEEQGCVNLETMDWVRPYDSSPDCVVFELRSAGRVFAFTAESSAEMKRWISTLEAGVQGARQLLHRQEVAKVASVTPEKIRLFDEKGPIALYDFVLRACEAILPCPENVTGEWTLTRQLKAADKLREYVSDMCAEAKKGCTGGLGLGGGLGGARSDVLAVGLIVVNAWVSERLEDAVDYDSFSRYSLGDLHQLIDWLSRYDAMMQAIPCRPSHVPVAALVDSPDLARFVNENTGKPLDPTYCAVTRALPRLCERYVVGGDGQDGAAAHLKEHCVKVWNLFLSNPEEAIQKHHHTGNFFTNTPIDIWEALNQHLSLATSTSSSLLHVQIAAKISEALLYLAQIVTTYLEELDVNGKDSHVKDIELELVCAIANDMAMHYDEVANLIDNVEDVKFRIRVDKLFDETMDNLVRCGTVCLRRLSAIVMADIKDLLAQVFSSTWLADGANTTDVAIATVSDYVDDFKDFLLQFWSGRLGPCILEEFISQYSRSIVSRGPKPVKAAPGSSIAAQAVSMQKTGAKQGEAAKTTVSGKLGSMFGFGRKKAVEEPVPEQADATEEPARRTTVVEDKSRSVSVVGSVVRASGASIKQIERDMKSIYMFFSDKCEEDAFNDAMAVLEDILELLSAESESLGRLLMGRINQYPPSTQAIIEVAQRCIALRDDLEKDEIDEIFEPLEPLVAVQTSEEVWQYGMTSIYSPGAKLIGTMYKTVLPNLKTLSQRLKDMTSLSMWMSKANKALEALADEEEEEEGSGHGQGIRATLVAFEKKDEAVDDDLMFEVLDEATRKKEILQLQQEEEEEAQRQLMKSLEVSESGLVSLEGKLDKKSPATKMWQNRYFKLSTKQIPRATGECDASGAVMMDYFYSLIWFKKKGGAALKDVDTRFISGMSLMQSSRKLCYDPSTFSVDLLFGDPGDKVEVEERGGADFDGQAPTVGTAQLINLATGSSTVTYFAFSIHTNKDMNDDESGGGKEKNLVLRSKSVDLMIEWLNTIAKTASLVYDQTAGEWVRGSRSAAAVDRLEHKMAATTLDDADAGWQGEDAREVSDAEDHCVDSVARSSVGSSQHNGRTASEEFDGPETKAKKPRDSVGRDRTPSASYSPKEAVQQVERASSIVDDGEGVDESQGANERKGSFFSKFNKPN